MKKSIFSLILLLGLLASLVVPALAAQEPPAYRLTKVTVTGESAMESTLVYDNGGWLPTQILDDNTRTLEYDEAGRVTSNVSATFTENYTYGEGEKPAGVTLVYNESGLQQEIAYSYDENGLLSRAESKTTDPSGAVSTSVTENTYDEHGNQTSGSVSYDGGEPNVSTYSYEYDEAGLAVSQTYNISQVWGDFTGTYTYTYDDQGRRTSESYDDGEIRYYYIPVLECSWNRSVWTDFSGDDTTGTHEEIVMTLTLTDDAGQGLISWSCSMTGEPTMEYDDNGCLVRAFDADGNGVELTYEPAV